MKYRKLRIAWSLAWGVLAVLLCVLWVRGYSWYENICYGGPKATIGIESAWGTVEFFRSSPTSGLWPPPGWSLTHEAWNGGGPDFFDTAFYWLREPGHFIMRLPNWIAILFATILASASWLRWRFSLRTLLAATALVAVGLGLIVWAAK
jgi:hypothetical protein